MGSPPPLYIAAYDLEAEPQISLPAAQTVAAVHRRHGVPATFFIVTRLLEQAGEDFRSLLDDELFDIESHTHTHASLKHVTDNTLRQEIERPIELIRDFFGREVVGITAPGGYTNGLRGQREVLRVIWEAGLRFVRSDARGPDESVPAPFTQPYWYGEDGYPDLLELPPQFWHDNVLKGYTHVRSYWPPLHPFGVPEVPPQTPEEEFAVWKIGADYVLNQGLRIYMPTLHPWSLYRMSSEARQLDLLLGYVQEQGMQVVSCLQVYEAAREGREDFPAHKQPLPVAEHYNIPRVSLLSAVNHDLRTPLHPLVGFSEMLASGALGPLNERQQSAADEMLRCAERLEYCLEEVVIAEKLAAGCLTVAAEVLSTKAIARQVAAQAAELSAGRVQCETHVEAGAEAVLADEVRLLEITAALLRNAITYHPGNPRLTFIVRREGDRVLLELSDDGPGIPPAMVPRLFLPLEQGPADSSTSLRGLGLGLTIASGLARLMAGDLRFRSADGGGATFTIELPAASPPDDAH